MKFRRISIFLVVGVISQVFAMPSNAATTLLGVATAVSTTLDQKQITLTPPRSNSPGKISVVIENTSLARADGLNVTLLAVGTTPITFVQEASGEYKAASRTTRLYIRAGTPILAPWANQTAQLSAGTYRLIPPISPSTGTWSYTSSNLLVATVTGDLISLLDGGNTEIRAVQSATPNWLSSSTSMTLNVLAQKPTFTPINDISFSINSISTLDLKDPISSSQGGWTYTSSDPQIVSVVGKRITALKPGVAVITARQSRWQAFSSHETTFKVSIEAVKADVVVGNFIDTSVTLLSSPQVFQVGLPRSSSPGTWSITSSDPTVVTVGNISTERNVALTALKSGRVKLIAIQAASGTFGQSQPIEITVNINARPVVGTLANLERVAGDPALTISFPTSQSKGTWSATSSAPNIVDVKENTLTFGDAGNATITLTQQAESNWITASTTFEVRVLGLTPTLAARNPIVLTIGKKASATDFPASNSGGKWIMTSANTAVVSVINGELVGISAGSTSISAYQESAGKFGRSNIITIDVRVKPDPKVGVLPNLVLTLGAPPTIIATPASSSAGTWVFTSNNTGIFSISGNRITAVGPGTAPVVARQNETQEFSEASQTFNVTVKLPPAPQATASASGRKITVKIANTTASAVSVTINGVKGKVGVNTVGPGTRTVTVKVLGKTILSKKFTIK